jgi:hypothetical protein
MSSLFATVNPSIGSGYGADMTVLYFILLLLAAICFGLAAFSVAHPRIHFVALGLLFWVLVPLIHAGKAL